MCPNHAMKKLFLRIKNKILISDTFIQLLSLFFDKIEYQKIVKTKQISPIGEYEVFMESISKCIDVLHPIFYLANSTVRKVFSPIGHTKNIWYDKKYLGSEISLYSSVSYMLSKSFYGLDYNTAFCWTSGWGIILNYALEKINFSNFQPDTIIEFGPGAGIFPLILGSKFKSKIFLFDFPIMSQLQKNIHRYLGSMGYPSCEGRISYINRVSDLSHILSEDLHSSLFIAYWSFSESPLELRDEFFEIFEKCKIMIFISNERIFNIDNTSFFESLSTKLEKTHSYIQEKLPLVSTYRGFLSNHTIHIYCKHHTLLS